MAGQSGVHDPGEDDGINDDQGQWIEDGPQSTQQGMGVALLKIPPDVGQDEATVSPQRAEHDAL